MEWLSDPQTWAALATLTALEIVLGINNIIFISILVGRLPPRQQHKARILGLGLLDTRYAHLHHRTPEAEAAIIVYGSAESTLTPLMIEVESKYRRLKVFSLPRMQPERYIELGVRGAAADVPAAIALIQAGVTALGFPWTDGPPAQ